MALQGVTSVSALVILRAGDGAKGLSLAVSPLAETAALALDPVADTYQAWTNEPAAADRTGRTLYGSTFNRLRPVVWDDVFTFTRSSSGMDLDRAGALQTLGTDVLRAGFTAAGDPAGYLLEQAATNALRSNDGTGAVPFAGTPAKLSAQVSGGVVTGITVVDGGSGQSVAPTVVFVAPSGQGSGAAATAIVSGGVVTGATITNGGTGYTVAPAVFARSGGAPTGMSGGAWSVVGTGTEGNIPYVDMRLRTPGGGATNLYTDITLDNSAALNMTPPATWALSGYFRLVGGSWANVNAATLLLYGSPGFNDNGSVSLLGVTAAPLATQRLAAVKNFTTAGNTAVSPRITGSVSGDVDVTLRCGLVQAEANHHASSPIRTSGAVVSRGPDVLLVQGNAFQQIFGAGASQGAVWLDVVLNAQAGPLTEQYLLQVDDGTNSNRLLVRVALNTASIQGFRVTGGAGTGSAVLGTITPGVPFRVGMAWNLGVVRFVGPSAAIVQHTGALLSGFTRLLVGGGFASSSILNGRVRGLYAAPRAPTDAKLLAASVLGADIDSILTA